MNTTDNYLRSNDHAELDQQLSDFLSRGGKIQQIPRGVSGMTDGLYGAVGARVRKNRRAAMVADDADE